MLTLNNTTDPLEADMPEYAAAKRQRQPTHPGKVITTILEGLSVSPGRAASEIGVSRPSFNAMLAGTSAMTPEMALRLGAYIGNDDAPTLWLRMQVDHDLWAARQKMKSILAKISRAAD